MFKFRKEFLAISVPILEASEIHSSKIKPGKKSRKKFRPILAPNLVGLMAPPILID